MTAVLNQISLLGNLSSPSYDVTAEDVQAMRDTITSAMEVALARFAPRQRQEQRTAFRFNPALH